MKSMKNFILGEAKPKSVFKGPHNDMCQYYSSMYQHEEFILYKRRIYHKQTNNLSYMIHLHTFTKLMNPVTSVFCHHSLEY